MLTSTDNPLEKKTILTRMKTEGEGDCAFHATFGEWDESLKKYLCNDITNQRKIIADEIRQCKRDSSIWPSVLEGIQQLVIAEKGGKEIERLKNEYQKFCIDNQSSMAKDWEDFEQSLTQHPEITDYIEEVFHRLSAQEKTALDTFHKRFSKCLTCNDGLLYGLIMSFEKLNTQFKKYNEKTNEAFDLKKYIAQSVLNEYADIVEKKGNWLLPGELSILAYASNKTIELYLDDKKSKSTKRIDSYNPGKNPVVQIYFDGINHYERLLNNEECLKLNQKRKEAWALTGQWIPESLNTYLMSHLLQAGFRGSEYQLSVLMLKMTEMLLSPDIAFEAEFESFGKGNLDDVVISVKNKAAKRNTLEAYQIKYYKHDIAFDDFYNENADNTKTEKMHIGKFFEGWLAHKQSRSELKEEDISCILYTNTDFDLLLSKAIDADKFSKDFINGKLKFTVSQSSKISNNIPKNFLKKGSQGVSDNVSKKVWEELQKQGILDIDGNMVDQYFQSKKILADTLEKNAVCKAYLPNISEILYNKHVEYKKNQVDAFELLYSEAWAYLKKQKQHNSLLSQADDQKREVFKNFLKSFVFKIRKPDIQATEVEIKRNLIKLLNIPPNQAFLCLYFALRKWFSDNRSSNNVPKLTSESIKKLLQDSKIENKVALSFYGRSMSALEQISCSINDKSIPRTELAGLQTQANKEKVIFIQGKKGIGKSGLVKQMLTNHEFCHPDEYLFVPASSVLDNKHLVGELILVLKNSSIIKYLIIDSAEKLLLLREESFKDFLKELQNLKQSLVFTITADGAQSKLWMNHYAINLGPFPLKDVTDSFSELYEYQNIQTLMQLASNPFYLSRIISFSKRNDMRRMLNSNNRELEQTLMGFAMDGHDPSLIQARQLLCTRLAYLRVRKLKNTGLPYGKAYRALIDEQILIENDDTLDFAHDLFYEYALMALWNHKWEMACIEGDVEGFWKENSQIFQQKNMRDTFEKWINLYAGRLVLELDLPEEGGYFGDLDLKTAVCRSELLPLFSRIEPQKTFRAMYFIINRNREKLKKENTMPFVEAFKLLIQNEKCFKSAIKILAQLVAFAHSELFVSEDDRNYSLGFLYEDEFSKDSRSALCLLKEVFKPNSTHAEDNVSVRVSSLMYLLRNQEQRVVTIGEFILKYVTDPYVYKYPNKISFLEFKKRNIYKYYREAISLLENVGLGGWENKYLSEQLEAYDEQENTNILFSFDQTRACLMGDLAASEGGQKVISVDDVGDIARDIFDRYQWLEGNMDHFVGALNSYKWTKETIVELVNSILDISDTGPEVLLRMFYLNQDDEEFRLAIRECGLDVLQAFDTNEIKNAKEEYQAAIIEAWEFLFIKWLCFFDQEIPKSLLGVMITILVDCSSFFVTKFNNREPNMLDVLINYKYSNKVSSVFLNNIANFEMRHMLEVMGSSCDQKRNRFLLADLPQDDLIEWCDSEEKALSLFYKIPISLEEEQLKEHVVLKNYIQAGSAQATASNILKLLVNKFSKSAAFLKDIKAYLALRIQSAQERGGSERAYFDQTKKILRDLATVSQVKQWANDIEVGIQTLEDEIYPGGKRKSITDNRKRDIIFKWIDKKVSGNSVSETLSASHEIVNSNSLQPARATAPLRMSSNIPESKVSRKRNKDDLEQGALPEQNPVHNVAKNASSNADTPSFLPQFQIASGSTGAVPMEIDDIPTTVPAPKIIEEKNIEIKLDEGEPASKRIKKEAQF